VARTIAHSMLVKRRGRGRSELGAYSGGGGAMRRGDRSLRLQIFIGSQKVCRNGMGCAFDERQAHRTLAQPVCDVRVLLGRGRVGVRFLTTD